VPIGAFSIAKPPRLPSGGYNNWWTDKRPAIQSLQLTRSWGSNPGTAIVHYVAPGSSEPPIGIPEGSLITLSTQWGHFFAGICRSDTATQTSQGHNRVLEFDDMRTLLDYDDVYCSFNRLDKVLENGVRKRRYYHQFPVDFLSGQKRWTPGPLTAQEIIRILLTPGNGTRSNPALEVPWIYYSNYILYEPVWHAIQSNAAYAPLDLDFVGVKLSAAITQICQAQGLTLTTAPTPDYIYRLYFARKGEGQLPSFTHSDGLTYIWPENSDDRSYGVALSGNPSRVRILGGRNKYQVLNIDMQADWNQNYNNCLDKTEFEQWIFDNLTLPCAIGGIPAGTRYNAIPEDSGSSTGHQLAHARSLTMTLRELCAFRGAAWADTRKFAGLSRMDMPVAMYLDQVVFKCFRPPPYVNIPVFNSVTQQYTLKPVAIHSAGIAGRPFGNLRIISEMLWECSHDPGAVDNPIYPVPLGSGYGSTDGKCYAVVKGYRIGKDAFEKLRPETFDLEKFIAIQNVWQYVECDIDESGEEEGGFIRFTDPIVHCEGMFERVDGGKYMFKWNPTFYVPRVKAALTFEGDRFLYYLEKGSGLQIRDHTENVSSLHLEVIAHNGTGTEVPLENGVYPTALAKNLAWQLLDCQFSYAKGGYVRKLRTTDTPTVLVPTYDRITLDIGPNGFTETIDFTSERETNAFIHEKDFDRARMNERLFPGQQQLMTQARQAQMLGIAWKQSRELSADLQKKLNMVLGDPGNVSPPCYRLLDSSESTKLPAGTPIFQKSDEKHPAMPSDTTDDHTGYVGATAVHQVPSNRGLSVQTGHSFYVRVKGPVEDGENVGRSNGNDYLVKSDTGVVGVAREVVPTGETQLIRVERSSGGGGGGGDLPVWL